LPSCEVAQNGPKGDHETCARSSGGGILRVCWSRQGRGRGRGRGCCFAPYLSGRRGTPHQQEAGGLRLVPTLQRFEQQHMFACQPARRSALIAGWYILGAGEGGREGGREGVSVGRVRTSLMMPGTLAPAQPLRKVFQRVSQIFQRSDSADGWLAGADEVFLWLSNDLMAPSAYGGAGNNPRIDPKDTRVY